MTFITILVDICHNYPLVNRYLSLGGIFILCETFLRRAHVHLGVRAAAGRQTDADSVEWCGRLRKTEVTTRTGAVHVDAPDSAWLGALAGGQASLRCFGHARTDVPLRTALPPVRHHHRSSKLL